jgi:hypothetical protein
MAVRLPAAQPTGRDHDRLAPLLTILPPTLPPNGTGGRMAAVQEVKAKEPVKGTAAIFPPDRNCPASVRQRHTSSDLGFC